MSKIEGTLIDHSGGIGSVGEIYITIKQKNVPISIGINITGVEAKNVVESYAKYYKTEDEFFIYHHYIVIGVIMGKYTEIHIIIRESKYKPHENVGLHPY